MTFKLKNPKNLTQGLLLHYEPKSVSNLRPGGDLCWRTPLGTLKSSPHLYVCRSFGQLPSSVRLTTTTLISHVRCTPLIKFAEPGFARAERLYIKLILKWIKPGTLAAVCLSRGGLAGTGLWQREEVVTRGFCRNLDFWRRRQKCCADIFDDEFWTHLGFLKDGST